MTKAADWIPLLNYSSRFGVSLSTLRRRIKSKTIEFKIENGKYFLLADGHGPAEQHESKPLPHSMPAAPMRSAPKPESNEHAEPVQKTPPNGGRQAVSFHHELPTHTFVEASVLSSANRLVEEIKAAYAKILQEKEEQISLLKEEAVDLRMLVKILEDNSKRNLEEAIHLRQKLVRQNAGALDQQANSNDGQSSSYVSAYEQNETGAQTAPPSESNFDSYLFENFQSRDV